MTEQEHTEIVKLKEEGRVALGIDRAFARKFYTDVSLARIAEETGETIYFEKAIVWFLFLAVPSGFIGMSVFSVLAFKWWSLLILPACWLFWSFYASESVRGTSRARFISILLILSLLMVVTNLVNLSTALFLLTFILTLWLTRQLYILSTFLLRCFVLRNVKAFSILRSDIIIKKL